MANNKKIGLYFGTFNPIHIGHLIIAESIMEWGDFDKVIFIPSYKPPHKLENISSVYHRINMLKIIIKNKSFFEFSLIDIERKGITYTIDTILELKKKYVDEKKIFFLVGSDSILDFHKWKDYKSILNSCQIVVAPRPKFKIDKISKDIATKIMVADIPMLDISSSEINERLKKKLSITNFVTKEIEDYIFSNLL